MSLDKYQYILKRKQKILDHFELEYPSTPRKSAKWKKWHLVLDGEKHYSPYKDIDAWYAHYNG